MYSKRRPFEELELFDAQIAKGNIEVCSGQEVSTHVLEVLTHEGSRYNSRNEVLTHRFKESTHIDGRQLKIEVSTYWVEESTHVDNEQIWN